MHRFHGSVIRSESVFNTLIKACARSTLPLRAAEVLEVRHLINNQTGPDKACKTPDRTLLESDDPLNLTGEKRRASLQRAPRCPPHGCDYFKRAH
jgi:hypothetical protein